MCNGNKTACVFYPQLAESSQIDGYVEKYRVAQQQLQPSVAEKSQSISASFWVSPIHDGHAQKSEKLHNRCSTYLSGMPELLIANKNRIPSTHVFSVLRL
jgi:hypothetical protein